MEFEICLLFVLKAIFLDIHTRFLLLLVYNVCNVFQQQYTIQYYIRTSACQLFKKHDTAARIMHVQDTSELRISIFVSSCINFFFIKSITVTDENNLKISIIHIYNHLFWQEDRQLLFNR